MMVLPHVQEVSMKSGAVAATRKNVISGLTKKPDLRWRRKDKSAENCNETDHGNEDLDVSWLGVSYNLWSR